MRQNGHEPIPGTGAPPAEAKPAIPEWMRNVTLGGGVLLWYYQPISVTGVENNVSVFFANIILDGKWGIFGLHLEPRFRDTKLRPFFDGPVWLQEAYASIDLGDATELRIGKTYSHLGLFWDNSFYGNVQVYDGLKLDPDYGLSLAGTLGKKDDLLGLGWWAQYFVIDGGTNVSLEGRDTISIPGAHRRNQGILRAEPRLHFGPATIALGASGEFFQASDLPGYGTQNVWRVAGDAKLTVGNLGVWGEVSYQDGRSVTAFPIAGIAATATTPAVPGQSSSKVQLRARRSGVHRRTGDRTVQRELGELRGRLGVRVDARPRHRRRDQPEPLRPRRVRPLAAVFAGGDLAPQSEPQRDREGSPLR